MDLDVRVRLVDDGTRPLNAFTGALDKFSASAERLTARAKTLTSGLRGLAGAFRDLHAVDGATGAATATSGRLRGMILDVGKAGKEAAPGIATFSRATSRLATNAGKAADGVGKLRAAMSTPLSETAIGKANAELREMLDLQRRARNGIRGIGGSGRRGMAGGHGERMPGLALALQPHTGALRSVYEQATSLQDAIVKMHLNGLSDSEIAAVRAKADEVAKLNKSTTPLSNLNAIMEARLALGGDLKEALATAGEMSKLRTIVGFSLGKDRAKSAEDGVYDMLRTGEVRGLIGDPARRGKLFQGMTAALIASNGRITPKMWHQTAIQGRSATQGFSDDFTNGRLPFLMQELQGSGKGGPAGTALQALFRAIPLAITKQTNIAEWRRLGFIDESKVMKGRHGGEKALPGAITLGKLAISDPDKAVFKLLDSIKAHGTTDRGAIIQKFAQLIGTGTGQTAVDILGLQRDRLDSFTRTLKMVEDSDALFAQIQQTASQSVENLDVSMKTLSGNIGSMVIPAFTSLVDATNAIVRTANGAAEKGGGNGNDPVKQGGGLSLLQMGLLGGGAAFGLGKLATRFPLFGRMMAGAAGSVVTGSPFGAALEPAITSGAKLLASKVPEAIKGGLVAGVSRGLLVGVAFEAGKALIDGALTRLLPKPNLAPEKQTAFDAHMKRWNDSWIWQKPGLIWQDAFGAHETTAPTVNIAGHRALGGPVSAGSTYLVGERGPELFTPGANGGISTNSTLRGLANSTGDVGQLGATIAESIRFQTFVLAQALRDIVSRLIRRHGGSGSGFDGSGDGSSGSGGGGYGRGTGGSSGGADGGGSGAGGGTADTPMTRAGLMDTTVASGARAFGLGGWRSLAGGGRQRFMAGTRAGRLGIGAVDPGAFRGASSAAFDAGKGRTLFDRKAPQVMARLMRDFNLGKEDAAAILGNLGHESRGFEAFEEDGKNGKKGPGRGWAQWTDPGRKRRFFQYAAGQLDASQKQRLDPHSDEANYGFLKWELEHTHKGALTALRRAQGLGNKVRAFEKPFENAGVKAYGSRDRYALRAMGMTPGVAPTAGSIGAFGLGGFNMPAASLIPAGDGSTGSAAPSTGTGSAGAVDLARSLRGGRAGAVARALNHYMHAGLWCADFVNGALAKAGIRGTMSAMSGSFLKWGRHVDNADIKKGDVLANNRHVGFARGSAEMHNGRMMIPMIAGNHGGKVGESWEPIGKYEARRAAEPQAQVPKAIKDHHAANHAREAGRAATSARHAGAGNTIHVGGITVHGKEHHDEKKIARAVHKQFNDAVATQLHDGAFA